MRYLIVLGVAATMSLPLTVAAQANCSANDVKVNLDWCSRDHGFNEGATCGVSALGGLGLQGLPALAPQPLLGNTWDRTNMMGAAKAAWKAGHRGPAVNTAICCQIHNAGAQACLNAHKDLVEQWFETQTK
jgi:hypothetical protein